jgi:hypothetical protein
MGTELATTGPNAFEQYGMAAGGEWTDGSDGKPRDPWQFTNSIVLVNPETEAVYTFQPSSRGGISAIGELCRAYGRRMRSHPDELPLIALDVSSYKHRIKELGEIRVPVLRVVDWVKGDATTAVVAQQGGMDDEIPF